MKGQILHFLTSCKIREGIGEISQSIFRLIISSSDACFSFRFLIDGFETRLGPKLEDVFSHFLPRKIRGGAGKCLSHLFVPDLGPNH